MVFRYLFAARFRFRCTECSYRNLIIRIIVLYNNNCAQTVSLVCELQKMISLELGKKTIKKLNHDLNQTAKTIFNLNRDLINDVKIKNVENNYGFIIAPSFSVADLWRPRCVKLCKLSIK